MIEARPDLPTALSRMHALPSNMDLWVLAGQSNMVGRATLKSAMAPHERVWNFSSGGKWETAIDPLHRLWESFTPVHVKMLRKGVPVGQEHLPNEHWAQLEGEARTGAGLGIAFGVAMTQAHGRPIGLIPCAYGGVSLEQWNPTHAGDEGLHSLYGAMLERIRQAGKTGTLKGVLWCQGESDAIRLEDAKTYSRRFTDWVRAIRSDTGVAE